MSTTPDSSPFRIRGLEQHGTIDLLREDMVPVQCEVLDRAAAMGLNRAYMGERWPDMGLRLIDYRQTLPELATPAMTEDSAKRRAPYEKICAHAKSLGIEPWVNLNIVNYPDHFTTLFPDAVATPPPTADRWLRWGPARGLKKQPQLCSSSPSFRKLVEAQLTELCRLPHIGGIETWLTGGDCDLFYCACETCRKKSMTDIVVEYASYAYPLIASHGKKFLIRCYFGGWRCALEADTWKEAAPRLPAGIEIAYKQVNGDLMNWHAPNAMAGHLQPHHEHVEFDPVGEYRGTNYGLVCSIRWQLQELVRHFRARGVASVCCRYIDKPNPFNLDVWIFGALAQNPDLDVAAWTKKWAAERYGATGDEVVAILDECAEIIRLSMYVQGVQWASWAVPQNVARLRFILFDRCAPCAIGHYDRLQPTPENIAEIIRDKDLAVKKAGALVKRCEALRGKLADDFLHPLLASVTYLHLYTTIARPLMESFFRYFAWSKTFSETSREYIRIPLLASLEAGKKQLETIDRELAQIDLSQLARLVASAGFVNADLHTKFREPFAHAKVIFDEIARETATESASWWAYYPSPDRWPEKLRGSLELYHDTRELD